MNNIQIKWTAAGVTLIALIIPLELGASKIKHIEIGAFAKWKGQDLSNLKEIIIKAEIAEIPVDMCHDLTSLESIVMESDTITKISTDAFYKCSSLVKVVLPKNLTDIETQAFYGDYTAPNNMEDIIIPESVKTIGKNVFYCRTVLLKFRALEENAPKELESWNTNVESEVTKEYGVTD